jgi:hypothetical protein
MHPSRWIPLLFLCACAPTAAQRSAKLLTVATRQDPLAFCVSHTLGDAGFTVNADSLNGTLRLVGHRSYLASEHWVTRDSVAVLFLPPGATADSVPLEIAVGTKVQMNDPNRHTSDFGPVSEPIRPQFYGRSQVAEQSRDFSTVLRTRCAGAAKERGRSA